MNWTASLVALVGCWSVLLLVRGYQHFEDQNITPAVTLALFAVWMALASVAAGLTA
jgi:hypothetical protein